MHTIQRGTRQVSPYFMLMELIAKVEELLAPLLEGTDIFVVSVKVKPTNNIKVFLDADDGFSVSKSSKVNKKLRLAIDGAGLFPEGDYSLEVSSPGVDEPLKLQRQYVKNIGRQLEVTPQEGPVVTGLLTLADDEKITLEIPAAPKKEKEVVEIPYEQIKQSVVQISF